VIISVAVGIVHRVRICDMKLRLRHGQLPGESIWHCDQLAKTGSD
jgi:hypothetical protein